MIKKFSNFVKHEVWQKREHELSSKKWWAVRQLRVILFTIRGLGRHDVAVRSAALSFFTVMSLVPILALLFAVFKGFGMDASFSRYFHELLPQYTDIVDQIVIFINNLLGRTRGGVMAVGAFFVLIWAVIQVFGNIERAFNNIWEVKRSRSFVRRFTGYMSLVILVPILMISANGIYAGIRREVEMFTGSLGAEILFGFVSLVLIILMFSAIYYVIPNIDVKYRNALMSGVVAGIGFSVFQVAYVYLQGSLIAYNAIYGTFAAIPLFLLWLQISWQILLFGGELSFAMQNVRDFEHERRTRQVSYDNKCKIMIATMVIVIRNYLNAKAPSTPETVAEEIGIPVRTVREIAYELETDGLILFVRNGKTDKVDGMTPAHDPGKIRFFDVINSVTAHGDEMPGLRNTALLQRIDDTYEKVKGDVRATKDNLPLVDLI